MFTRFISALAFSVSSLALAAPKPIGIFIDAKTEAKIGDFPYDRQVYATALQTFSRLGADSVVLKFFLDLPKSDAGDRELAAAMSTVPAFLQAAIEENTDSLPLSSRFACQASWSKPRPAMAGKEGFIPLALLQEKSVGLGFVNASASGFETPMAVDYRGTCFPNLILPLLSRITSKVLALQPGQSLTMGSKKIPLTAENQMRWSLPKNPAIYYSYLDVLEGKIGKNEIKGNMIIFGYEGKKAPNFETPKGKMGAHVLFLNLLQFLSEIAEGSTNK